MMNRKTAWGVLALVLLALVFVVLSGAPEKAEAQTAPAWTGANLDATSGLAGVGKYPVWDTVLGDRTLSMVQLMDVSSVTIAFWGRDVDGVWTRLAPVVDGYAVGDTALTFSSGSPAFRFIGATQLEVITISAGSATVWGE